MALFLLFLIQCLRSFAVVSVRGQDILTLVGHALLTLPTVAVVFFYVCAGIGLARGLRALQASQELHIIHSSNRLPALMGGIGAYTGACTLIILLLTHVVEPGTNRQFNEWSASIAADLVGRTLTPDRFAEVVPGVTIFIGDRKADGELSDFLADDNRVKEARRTYVARTATVTADEEGYVLQLRDGAIQYMQDDRRFSEIAFTRYDIALDRLTGPTEGRDLVRESDSFQLVARALASGNWDHALIRQLANRTGEAIRVIALCLFVAAVAAFPHGRRAGREVPIELVVLGTAFLERGLSSNLIPPGPLDPVSGAFVLGGLSLAVLLMRLRILAPVPRAAST